MRQALQLANKLCKEKVIQRYALGGGIATAFYIEPLLTFDVDIFYIAKRDSLVLDPVIEYLMEKKFHFLHAHVLVGNIPVQFIPAERPLWKEAVDKARAITYEGVPTRVMSPEHLLAIALDTNRLKDRERAWALRDKVNSKRLIDILGRYDLLNRWQTVGR